MFAGGSGTRGSGMKNARTVHTFRLVALAATFAILAGACGRPAQEKESTGESTTTTAATRPTSSAFGSVDDVCQPGNATGATARG